MRVLFLVHAHPDLQAGGTEIFARDLFRGMKARGVSGTFLASTAAHQRNPSPGTPLQTVAGSNDEILVWTGGFDSFFLSQIDLHGVASTIADLVREQQPDIIHFHHLMGLGAEMIGLVRRCAPQARIVMTLHDYYLLCANDGQMVTQTGHLCHAARTDACHKCFPDRSLTDIKLREVHLGQIRSNIDHFISPSHFLKARFVEHGFDPAQIAVIPNGIPYRNPVPARAAVRRDRFAFFGHINRFKGATIALQASALLSKQGIEHKLWLHGGTDHQTADTIRRFETYRTAAPSASYRGPYRRAELPNLISQVDWLLFPSEWWENAPLVISEAFQHWRPVICSDVGGASEAVTAEINGLHFPVGDAEALAEAMRRAIEQQDLWQRLVDGISPPVTIDQSTDLHLNLFSALLSSTNLRFAA